MESRREKDEEWRGGVVRLAWVTRIGGDRVEEEQKKERVGRERERSEREMERERRVKGERKRETGRERGSVEAGRRHCWQCRPTMAGGRWWVQPADLREKER